MSASEIALGKDHMGVGAIAEQFEVIRYKTEWLVEKFSEEACAFVRKARVLDPREIVSRTLFASCGIKPEEEAEALGNLLLNEGIQTMLDLLIGGAGTAYSNANAQLGVGDSSTAEAATQTDLQASTNKLFKAMNATYPQRTNQTMAFQSDFGSSEANYTWNEASIRNGASADKNLNRKVQNLGTKASGTWTLTAQVTIS